MFFLILCQKKIMTTNDIEQHLAKCDIKPTANRILVYKELSSCKHPASLADLELNLSPMDKASIFRVLTLFARRDVVHAFEDGSGSMKYELCRGEHHHSIDDMHAHFYCDKCGETFCLTTSAIPLIDVPDGFEVSSINYTIKGTCPKCSGK